jgi:hypothetical protein
MPGQSSWISIEKISCGHGTEVKCGPNSLDVASSASQRSLFSGATIAIGCEGASTNQSDHDHAPGSNIGVESGNRPMPHIAAISLAQLSAGNGVILDTSNGLHSHTVTLTDAQVMQIAARASVSVDSSRNTHSNGADPHAHTVTF